MTRLSAALLVASALLGPAYAQDPAPAPAPAPEPWVQKTTADLILLDKIRAQPTALSVKLGDTATFGPLAIKLLGCASRPPDQPADSAAFVAVSDNRTKTDVFRGWVLANTPSVSQMEHPIYDLKLAQCR